MADMVPAELGKLLDELNRDRAQGANRSPLGKIRALWWSLYWLGEVNETDDTAILAFVRRQTGIEHLRFLGHRQAPAVIEALKSWLSRAGVRWWSEGDIKATCGSSDTTLLTLTADRHAVLAAILHRLQGVGVIGRANTHMWIGSVMGLDRHILGWTTVELDMAIRKAGRCLRGSQ